MSVEICTVVITGRRKLKNTKLTHIGMTFGTSLIKLQYFQNLFLGGGGGRTHRHDDIMKRTLYLSTYGMLNDAASISDG
jgi:hypothetical protein